MRHSLRYGPELSQEGDLHLPEQKNPLVVCLLHGGFWKAPYGRDQMTALAEDLARRGFAAWNLGYRRLGEPGGGWPGTLEDVAHGINALVAFETEGLSLDLNRVLVVGHSAGGHLALLSALCEDQLSSRLKIIAVAGMAPLADLVEASRLALGHSAVEAFLGGSPQECPDRYAEASPMARIPLRVPQLLLHGDADQDVPLEMSRSYAERARLMGDDITLHVLKGAGHMDFLAPASEGHEELCRWIKTHEHN